jgi:acyl carrier protein
VVRISPEQIEEAIREILASELEVDTRAYAAEASSTPLLGRGIGLDSIDALTLITALEKRFDIEVSDEDLTVALFKSVRILAAYVSRKISERFSDVSTVGR